MSIDTYTRKFAALKVAIHNRYRSPLNPSTFKYGNDGLRHLNPISLGEINLRIPTGLCIVIGYTKKEFNVDQQNRLNQLSGDAAL